jgi:UDP-N-acetylmuramoyl-L-alanyl-D-glutamate--2,6-diaminopimelate ligase
MKRLSDITENVKIKKINGTDEKEITSISYDSRKCAPGCLFVALRGTQADGHGFIQKALDNGASAVICEEIPENIESNDATIIVTDNSRKALAAVSHEWYGKPTSNMKVIGITGTNGKTTTTFLLKSLLEAGGEKCGIIGTTGIYYLDKKITATHTTPESLELCSYFAEMRDNGTSCVIMEVSSHALHQHRADYIDFNAGLFSNLTHEHLDYHKTMEEYASAKRLLFEKLGEDAIAIANDSGGFASFMLEGIRPRRKYVIGWAPGCDIIIKDEELNVDSSEFNITFPGMDEAGLHFKTRLPGRFNIENAAISVSLALAMGMDKTIIQKALAQANGAPGRMQRILLRNGSVGIVDYAHTPDALEKALKACREILQTSGNQDNRLICVFGCGGDRDASKRPIMGELSARLADFTIITNDNPRTEDPNKIFENILDGISEDKRQNLCLVPDRSKAIEMAADLAGCNDIILVAGKGHEDYQIVGTEKHHFDDFEELEKFA